MTKFGTLTKAKVASANGNQRSGLEARVGRTTIAQEHHHDEPEHGGPVDAEHVKFPTEQDRQAIRA